MHDKPIICVDNLLQREYCSKTIKSIFALDKFNLRMFQNKNAKFSHWSQSLKTLNSWKCGQLFNSTNKILILTVNNEK